MLCHICAEFLRSATGWAHPQRVWQLIRRFVTRTLPASGEHDNDYFQKHYNTNSWTPNDSCVICQLMVAAAAEILDNAITDDPDGLLSSPRGYTLGLSNFRRTQVYNIVKNNHFARRLTVCFHGSEERVELGYIYPPTSVPMDKWGPHRSPAASSGKDCESTFELATAWLSVCSSHHHKCRSAQYSSRLPTRVINVGPADGSEEPRLHEPRPGQEELYIALSHCWGKLDETQKLTTTTATKAARLVSIPLASMPQTFRDAVIITRRLNIRYLWIDSLCIIQDSHADWEAEAARMADVYRNAHLTVAASHSSDSTGGCFSNAPRREETTTVCLPLKKDARGLCCCLPSTHARKFGNHLFLLPSPQLTGGPSNGTAQRPPLPLETRAWTLQERVLSPRFLSFEQGQIAWSCAGMTCNTADSQGLVTEDPSSRVQRILSLSWWGSVLGRLGKPIDAASLAGAHDVWITLVEDYSRRHLTRESDRLIAIKGVADALGGATGDTYLAGLWRRWLLVGLVWCAAVDGNFAPEPSPPFAPSWSWAAAGVPVTYLDLARLLGRFETYIPLARVVGARTEGTPAAQSGEIFLEGDTKVFCPEQLSLCNIRSRFENPDPARADHVVDLGQRILFDPAFWRTPESETLVLALFADCHPPGYVLSLLLVEVEGCPGSFRRVGVAQWYGKTWFGRDVTPQFRKDAWAFRGGDVPFDAYARGWYGESHPTEKIVLRII